ncbi:MAG TPA: hypothetical protein VJQ59_06840, partial [Candidatus Sulfotelmatobacter sp.]|nr:hypothetical protein [Candidatus Sulfotelmatobacter sp.]
MQGQMSQDGCAGCGKLAADRRGVTTWTFRVVEFAAKVAKRTNKGEPGRARLPVVPMSADNDC